MAIFENATSSILLGFVVLSGCGDGSGSLEQARRGGANPQANSQMDQRRPATSEEGRFRPIRVDEGGGATLEELEQLGYAAGSKPTRSRTGVVRHDPERAQAGLNLYVSGHAPEAVLMNMEGEVLHRWTCSFQQAFSDYPPDKLATAKGHWRTYFRRAELLENGDLLIVFEGHGLARINRDSQVLWAYGGGAHHDFQRAADGDIWVLTRTASMKAGLPVLEDYISVLDPNGVEQRRISVLECFENSDDDVARASLKRKKRRGDLLHTNTLEVLDGAVADRVPAFAAGNVLISCLKTDTIAVIDPDAERVVWARTGPWVAQHQPTVLDNGNLMVFDNRGGDVQGRESLSGGATRVLETDVETGEILWVFEGTASAPFETWTCGSNQRLQNGNTLVTESDNGRAIEITPEHQLVWEFLSPHVAGPGGQFVATLFELVRLPPDHPTEWLE